MEPTRQPHNHPLTFTDRIRALTADLTRRLGSALHQAGIHPDTLTLIGLIAVIGASALIALGELALGGLLLLIALPLDALDGAVARAMRRSDRFGELFDSTLDRYADAVIFASLGYYFAVEGRMDVLALAFAALIGSYGVSYVRARAQGIGVEVRIGWFSRMERLGIIIPLLFVPALLPWGLLVLAVGTNFTTLQRVWFVYKTLKEREKVH